MLSRSMARINATSPEETSDHVINVIIFHIILFSTEGMEQVCHQNKAEFHRSTKHSLTIFYN